MCSNVKAPAYWTDFRVKELSQTALLCHVCNLGSSLAPLHWRKLAPLKIKT